jgi:hypothetical protein
MDGIKVKNPDWVPARRYRCFGGRPLAAAKWTTNATMTIV